jgi:putative nucleotidyltransferase with HDIG domain
MVDSNQSQTTVEDSPTYISIPLSSLNSEVELPGPIFLCIRHKLVKYKNKADLLNADAFNKLVYNHVKTLFILEADRISFQEWVEKSKKEENAQAEKLAQESPEAVPILNSVQETRRKMLDLFTNPKGDMQSIQTIEVSKKMVTEFLKRPYAINNIQTLQRYSKGCVDHSVNVAVLSVFLGLRIGYSHQGILENLAMGALFHDIGKTLTNPKTENLFSSEEDIALQQHPRLGAEFLDKQNEISSEVKMIVAQHHECLDGSGYPARLKGLAVYDLARVVAIANTFDNLISESVHENLKDRMTEAVDRLENEFDGKFDTKKLEKVIKVLRYSMV